MITAFIPARSGSKRVPRKNLQTVGGKPLVRRAVDLGLAVADEVVVSVDDHEISDAIKGAVEAAPKRQPPEFGHGYRLLLDYRRPEMSKDDVTLDQLLADWIHGTYRENPANTIIVLLPTCPFVRKETLDDALYIHLESVRTVLAGVRVHETYWHAKTDRDTLTPIVEANNSQTAKEAYLESGAFSIFTRGSFLEHQSRRSPDAVICPVSKLQGFDIDTPEDLAMARKLVELA